MTIQCRLTMFGDAGKRHPDVAVGLDELPDQLALDQLYDTHMARTRPRYAVVREGTAVRALYLAPDLVPREAVRFRGYGDNTGRWATTSVPLGDNSSMRAITGPSLFFRQLDLQSAESWMAPVLMRFHKAVDVSERDFGNTVVHQWGMYGQEYFCTRHRSQWQLYCAGSISPERLEAAVAEASPTTAEDFLWAIGAIPLSNPRKDD